MMLLLLLLLTKRTTTTDEADDDEDEADGGTACERKFRSASATNGRLSHDSITEEFEWHVTAVHGTDARVKETKAKKSKSRKS